MRKTTSTSPRSDGKGSYSGFIEYVRCAPSRGRRELQIASDIGIATYRAGVSSDDFGVAVVFSADDGADGSAGATLFVAAAINCANRC